MCECDGWRTYNTVTLVMQLLEVIQKVNPYRCMLSNLSDSPCWAWVESLLWSVIRAVSRKSSKTTTVPQLTHLTSTTSHMALFLCLDVALDIHLRRLTARFTVLSYTTLSTISAWLSEHSHLFIDGSFKTLPWLKYNYTT